jgi:transcriptional regulator with XRE-family HTH domain
MQEGEPRTALEQVLIAQGRRRRWVAQQLDPPVDVSTVHRWLNGERPLPAARLKQLAKLLGVDEAALREPQEARA